MRVIPYLSKIFAGCILYCCLCSLTGSNIRFVRIKNDNGRYYELLKRPKTIYKDIPANVYKVLPDTLDYYSFRIDDAKKKEVAGCISYISELKEEFVEICNKKKILYTEAGFSQYWISRRQACFIMLKSLYPVLVFEFDNADKSSFKLRSLTVNNYTKKQKLGSGNPYLDNNGLGIKNLILDPQKSDSTYSLQKTQDLGGQSTYHLALTCLTTDYRSDDPPVSYLISITFNFEDRLGRKYPLSTKPFLIDL